MAKPAPTIYLYLTHLQAAVITNSFDNNRLIVRNFRKKMLSDNLSLPFKHQRFNDLILYPYITEEVLSELPQYKTHPGDVFIVTYPKAGTFWLAEIVYNIAKPKPPSEEVSRIYTIPFLEFFPQETLESYPSPRYLKTHLPYEMVPCDRSQDSIKYIYLARNPRDVAVSYFHYLRAGVEFEWDGTWSEFLRYFIEGNVPYGGFFDHVLPWWNRKDDENVLFIKYEDMKKDLRSHINLIAEFLGFKLSSEEAEFVAEKSSFKAMKADPQTNMEQFSEYFKSGTSFMRKGITGDWVNHFSDEQLKEFEQWYASHIDGTGLDFEFTL